MTIIAGYPWFGDWGRDTMIALPGLALSTGRPELAVWVLRTFARFLDRGMLANRFPDYGEQVLRAAANRRSGCQYRPPRSSTLDP